MVMRQFRWILLYLAPLSIMFIPGCYTNKPPQEVAQYFWDAMKVQDIEGARKHSTMETRNLMTAPDEQLRDVNVKFGKILIDGNTATIETIVHMQRNGTETTLPSQTILKREDGEWRVDYQQTKKGLEGSDSPADIAEDVQKLGQKISNHMDKALDEVKQKIPEYTEQVKKLGEAASKKMDEAWQRQVTEIKKIMEEFGKILDQTVKKDKD